MNKSNVFLYQLSALRVTRLDTKSYNGLVHQ